MKVLVTGATGFIGNYVVRQLLNEGCDVIATSRDEKELSRVSWKDEVLYIPADLNEQKPDRFSFFKKPDALIHLAWEGLPNYKDLFHLERNLPANYFFLKNMVRDGLQDLTVIGTCFEYGLQNGRLSEDTPTHPVTAYGLAKDSLRKFLIELQKSERFSLKWARLFYLYGEGQNEKSLLAQLDKAVANKESIFNMSGGEQLRDYLPVERVAQYIAAVALQNDVQGIVNCCNGIPISIRKLVEDRLQEKGASLKLNLGFYPYPDYEPMAFWGDNGKLQNIIAQKRYEKK